MKYKIGDSVIIIEKGGEGRIFHSFRVGDICKVLCVNLDSCDLEHRGHTQYVSNEDFKLVSSEKTKFKVGDKVRIREDAREYFKCSCASFVPEMDKCLGEWGCIVNISYEGYSISFKDCSKYLWNEECFDAISNTFESLDPSPFYSRTNAELSVGDRVLFTGGAHNGETGTIIEKDHSSLPYHILLDHSPHYSWSIAENVTRLKDSLINIEKETKENTMNRTTLNESQKKNLSTDAATLVEAGYYNSDLTLTSTTNFVNFLVAKFEKEYAAAAREELKLDDAKRLKK